jgi:hypothetical protein
MAPVERQFPNLFQLLGGYFHQDWCLDDPNAEAALRRYMNDTVPGQVQDTVNEIDALLTKNLSDDQLKQMLLVDLGCYYDPTADNITHAEWLRWVQNRLREG